MSVDDRPARPLDVAALPPLSAFGFTGGRDSFHAFCAKAFAPGAPRFFRTEDNELVVYRHADLRAFGALMEVANVPPAVLFPAAFPEGAGEPRCPRHSLAGVISNQVFTANPPIHAPIRRLLLNQFGPRPTQQREAIARRIVEAIFAALPQEGEIDLVTEVAEPLTARFWGEFIGMNEDETRAVAVSVRAMTPLLFIERSAEQLKQVDAAFAAYSRIIEGAAERSLKAGDHPALAEMQAELAGLDYEDDPAHAGLVPKTLGALLAGNLFDGFHTAAVGAVNAVHGVLANPAALADLRRDPAQANAAVAEALRLEPPVLMLRRQLSADIDYDGHRLAKGQIVAMMWAAGDHDPEVFADPDRFDAGRPHQGLTTFGGGAHICPGRFVAAMLARVLLEVMLARGIALEPVPDAEGLGGEWIPNHLMAQRSHLHLRISQPMTV